MQPDPLPDPLLEKLRALPAVTPDPALLDRVARAALTELASGGTSRPLPEPPLPGWRTYLELAVYRAAVPTALAGATIIYLSWAVSAASHLY